MVVIVSLICRVTDAGIYFFSTPAGGGSGPVSGIVWIHFISRNSSQPRNTVKSDPRHNSKVVTGRADVVHIVSSSRNVLLAAFSNVTHEVVVGALR